MDAPSIDDGGSAIDALYAALSKGDIAAARACCTEDFCLWHNFDRIEQNRDEAAIGWGQFIGSFPERAFIDVRRSATAQGFVQQHLVVGRTQSGARIGWPLCIVVKMRDGLIARIDEYIDRAGSYAVVD